MPELSRRKKLAFAVAAITLPPLALLLALEIYVRLASPVGYVTPAIYQQRQLLYRPALFCRHIHPQQEHTAVDEAGNPRWTVNALGYRGEPFTVEKPRGTVRIMIYGGSAVFDGGSPEGRDWPHRIQARLRRAVAPGIEVINAGIGGHASFDSFGRFLAEGHTFQPDIVLLYHGWNDIKTFHNDKPLLRAFKPFTGDPFVTYQNGFDRLLCEHSQLFVRLRDRYFKWKLNIGPEGQLPTGEPRDAVGEAGLRQFLLTCETFADLVRNAGAQPVLMTQALLIAPDNDAAARERIRYDYVLLTHRALCETVDRMDAGLREIATRREVPLIDAADALSGRPDLFADHVHLNAAGSTALSRLVATQLQPLVEARLHRDD